MLSEISSFKLKDLALSDHTSTFAASSSRKASNLLAYSFRSVFGVLLARLTRYSKFAPSHKGEASVQIAIEAEQRDQPHMTIQCTHTAGLEEFAQCVCKCSK